MSEPLIVILLFVAVIAFAAVVFGLWLMVAVFRLIGRGIASLFSLEPAHPALPGVVNCPRGACRAINPTGARFCRRCGQRVAG